FHWVHVSDAPPMMLVDTTFAAIVALAAHGLGAPVTPIRIELARRRADERMLREAFGCPIHFDAPLDQLVLDERLFARRSVTRTADALALLVPALESALAENATSGSIADEVRAALSRRMTGERPSVEKIAHELRVSPRTLQRRLREAGTSY